jgi:hypothetical protein
MGAFDSFGRSLNAIFEKRPPWPARRLSGGLLEPKDADSLLSVITGRYACKLKRKNPS